MRQMVQSKADSSGFQWAVVGGPETVGKSLNSRQSLPALLKPRLSWSKLTLVSGLRLRAESCAVSICANRFDFALSKLLSLLAGGVSGARGRFGMFVGRVGGSVGRRAAGTYSGCRGCRTCRTLRWEWCSLGDVLAEGGVWDIALVYSVASGGEGALACGLRKYLLLVAGGWETLVDIMLGPWSGR